MTLSDITDLRSALEQGLAAGVQALQINWKTRQNSVNFQNDTPRVEITVAIGAATGAKRAFQTSQTIRFSRWNFVVKFEVLTRPQPALTPQQGGESDADYLARVDANNGLHETLVADIRAFASTAAQNSWNDLINFPNHFIAECLRDTGSPSDLKPQEGYEQTAMNFAGVVGIRESAWLQSTS